MLLKWLFGLYQTCYVYKFKVIKYVCVCISCVQYLIKICDAGQTCSQIDILTSVLQSATSISVVMGKIPIGRLLIAGSYNIVHVCCKIETLTM